MGFSFNQKTEHIFAHDQGGIPHARSYIHPRMIFTICLGNQGGWLTKRFGKIHAGVICIFFMITAIVY